VRTPWKNRIAAADNVATMARTLRSHTHPTGTAALTMKSPEFWLEFVSSCAGLGVARVGALAARR
jgi:hypothetical protein